MAYIQVITHLTIFSTEPWLREEDLEPTPSLWLVNRSLPIVPPSEIAGFNSQPY